MFSAIASPRFSLDQSSMTTSFSAHTAKWSSQLYRLNAVMVHAKAYRPVRSRLSLTTLETLPQRLFNLIRQERSSGIHT